MLAKSPEITASPQKALRALGQQIRVRRKILGITAVTAAEAAGLSRVTLHRIERGEATVAVGAYFAVAHALGLALGLSDPKARIPPRLTRSISIGRYPQLKRLAWQLSGTQKISPQEALDLYERNWRHVDVPSLTKTERELIRALLAAFGREQLLV